MNSNSSVNFTTQYQTLGLEKTADWDTVQRSYRKLVNKWHPDRHQEGTEEAAKAEQHFILITRAFNILRDFNRENNRLPLQAATGANASRQSDGRANGPSKGPSIESDPHYEEDLIYSSYSQSVAPNVSDDDLLSSSILKHSEKSPIRQQTDSKALKKNRYFMGSMTMLLMMVVTLVLMFQLDQRNSEIAKQKASEALRAQKPSKFLRSAQEIQHSSGTGAFLEATPANSALGNQIRGDTFSK